MIMVGKNECDKIIRDYRQRDVLIERWTDVKRRQKNGGIGREERR